ncbi:MAG: beta-ketoacyl-ACP synthase 3, partial [Candidatus Marinimicrobia bacterium]|nr:beta-ketoacyl-ACP synthase 3 [Candidatus Neomarinimicrobiota bacterium]
MKTRISGHGFYVPEKIVTNFDLEKIMDTNDEWIRERSGIHERHFVGNSGEGASDLGVNAAEKAIEKAGIDKNEIDVIIVATLSPDYFVPGIGTIIQKKMGLGQIPAFDLRQQCSGFVYGLEFADALIKSGKYKKILLIGTEVQSTGLNLTNEGRDTAVLFGDGAGAFILSAEEDGDSDIIDSILHSDGKYFDYLWIESPSSIKPGRINAEDIAAGKSNPSMNGKAVFKHAVTKMPAVVEEILQKNNISKEKVKIVIP